MPAARRFNWFQRQIGRGALRALKYAGIPLRDPALVAMFGRQDSYAGIEVDEDTSLNSSAVWSAVNLISSARAILPCHVYKRDGQATDNVDYSHTVETLLNVSPNPVMTAYTFAECMQASALTWGNGYGHIYRDKHGNPYEVWPLHASQVKPKFDDAGVHHYEYRKDASSDVERIESADMIHIMGLTSDGISGLGPVARARQSIGLGLATEKYGASFFGNGATPRQILTHPDSITAKGKQNIRQSWNGIYSNAQNPHAIAVLDEGMTLSSIGLPPEDSQFLETRQFQVIEICRWFRVPPHMLYDLTQATNGNNEQQNLNFLTFTLIPWLIRWNQELTRKLFTPADHVSHFLDFDTTPLLMTDMKTRYESYNTGRNGGWLTLNDIMRYEKRPLLPAEIGDTHLAPSTMRVLESRDPSQPVDVETIGALQRMLESLATRNNLTAETATEILKAVIPSATDGLVTSLVTQFTKLGYVK